MSFRSGGVKLACRVARKVDSPFVDLPAFLCPAFLSVAQNQTSKCSPQRRRVHTTPEHAIALHPDIPDIKLTGKELHEASKLAKLPAQCTGCGAFAQTVDDDEAGYFNLKRKSVREFLQTKSRRVRRESEEQVVKESLKRAAESNPALMESLEFDMEPSPVAKSKKDTVVEQPVCERCHALKHHEIGVSIHHPSIQSIEDTILESPHKYNHIYHVIDAADFPMSLVPGLNKLLNITPLRSLNRRSKTGKFFKGKKTELSFIITRSDLLAPKKEQVDSMMPYLRDVLRTALGRVATDVRLGNLRCVSAKRGWWTKEMKEDIWTRGGGGWMVGKVNVGKSQLFHEIYPKGRRGKVDYGPKLTPAQKKDTDWRSVTVSAEEEEVEAPALFGKNMAFKPIAAQEEELERASMAKELEATEEDDVEDDDFSASELSLLPPAQIEEDYPAMPLVSALPGTTASPIRVPFGNGKGELIDLPGMARGDLELHVQEEHRTSLVMRSRVRPEQKTIKPGQSLLLGGFIRITPTTPDLIFLSYSFNPLKPHVTSTEKAIGTQTQERESSVEDISIPGTGEKIKSAGTFHLKWDVTKLRTGPITARDAAKIHVDRLPYRVMAADILIEGCGWVELVAQIRKPYGHAPHKNYESKPQTNYNGIEERPLETNAWGWGVKDDTKKEPERRKEKEEEAKEKEEVDPTWPAVEVFTPDGKFAAVRQPMNAWMMCAKKPSEKAAHGRPRRSMKGMKKLGKIRARAAAAAAV